MSILEQSGPDLILDEKAQNQMMDELVKKCLPDGAKKVLLIPPDHTRLYSGAGRLTSYLYSILKDKVHVDVLPALGTHVPMDEHEINLMFGDSIPLDRFIAHRWRDDLTVLGEVSSEYIKNVSEGRVDYAMQVAINKHVVGGGYDLMLSIGQIVPHEVIGMANYTKNILIGTGGGDSIHKSHFLGAAFGMERIMGRIDTPVRKVLNKGFEDFLKHLPIVFVLTVMQKLQSKVVMRGLYCGKEESTFRDAAQLSQKVNLDLLSSPISKAVVYLDPREFKTTWLGNKAVYRLRMAMADRGELIILAPALKGFGEDVSIDALIRKYGYKGTELTLKAVRENADLQNNLSAAAHLIHGSSDDRFHITYCPGNGVTQQEIEGVGFSYAKYEDMVNIYNPETLKDGYNEVNGETIFFVSNPALGLWALKSQFE
jgi:nickel-dependent lactate racemase